MAIPVDIEVQIYAGDDVDINVQIKDADGNVIDYSNYQDWRCQWRRNERSSDFVSATVTQNGDYMRISFTHEQTRDMGGDGFIDLQSLDGVKIRTWFKAKAKYVWDVTRND